MGGLPISGTAFNFFHATKEISPCKKHSRLEMEKPISEEGSLSVTSDFFEIVENDELLTAKEANGAVQLFYFLERQGKGQQNICLANKFELEVISAVTKNLIKLASRRYQREVSEPTIKFLNYLNQSKLSKNNFVPSIANLASAAADFAKLKYGSIAKTRETADKLLAYFENDQSYSRQTALNKMLFNLDVISLAAHPGPNIPKLTRNFLHALKENNICKDNLITEMAKSILEEEPNLLVIRDFFKLTEISKLKEAIVGFLALLSSKEAWVDYIEAADKSEEEALKYIRTNLLFFANNQDAETSKTILNFAAYASQSKLTGNQHAFDIAKTILSAANFSKLRISPEFKNTFLTYLQTDNIPGADEAAKFTSHLTRFANTADLAVAESICDLLTHLSQAKAWKGHWLSNLAADVLSQKEKNLPSVGAFKSLVSQSELTKNNKKSEIEKFTLKFSDLLKNEKAKIINESLRRQINYLMARLYNQMEGELNDVPGKAKIVMDFLGDFVKLRKWDDQKANALALDVADMIVALRDFLKIKTSSDRKITEEKILSFKNSFLAYLQTEVDDPSKRVKEKKKFEKFQNDLNGFVMTPDTEISGPTSRLITCLNKLEMWEGHKISRIEKYNLKMRAIAPFIQAFSELWTDNQLSEYFKNHKKGNILNAVEIDVKFFLVLLTNEDMLPILSPKYSALSGRDIRASLISRLIFLVNDSNKRVSDAAMNILNHLDHSKEWKGHPAQEIARIVLLETCA